MSCKKNARYLLFLRLFWTAGLRDYRTTGLLLVLRPTTIQGQF